MRKHVTGKVVFFAGCKVALGTFVLAHWYMIHMEAITLYGHKKGRSFYGHLTRRSS